MFKKYTPEQQILIFWKRVNKDGSIPAHCSELGQCWEWLAAHLPKGYGFQYWDGKREYAHRISWLIVHGSIPDNILVLHKCDNPKCVNPKHLYLGTHQDNMDDMANKGRRKSPHLFGETNSQHKLTSTQVKEIRQRYANGETNKSQLGREYGVSNVLIGLIIRLRAWKNE